MNIQQCTQPRDKNHFEDELWGFDSDEGKHECLGDEVFHDDDLENTDSLDDDLLKNTDCLDGD